MPQLEHRLSVSFASGTGNQIYLFPTVVLGSETYQDVRVLELGFKEEVKEEQKPLDGFMALPFLARHKVTFDFPHQTMYLRLRRPVGAVSYANVTAIVTGLVTNNQLNFVADNTTMGGDPAPNITKALQITFTLGGTNQTLSFTEGSTVQIGGGGLPLTIIQALYGNPGTLPNHPGAGDAGLRRLFIPESAARRACSRAFGDVRPMTRIGELLHWSGYGVVLSLMFQVSAWVVCFFNGSMYGPAQVSGGVLLNWRVWFISCAAYWLGFLGVFLTRRQRPPPWRVLYTGLGFPALFIAAAILVPRVYGAD